MKRKNKNNNDTKIYQYGMENAVHVRKKNNDLPVTVADGSVKNPRNLPYCPYLESLRSRHELNIGLGPTRCKRACVGHPKLTLIESERAYN